MKDNIKMSKAGALVSLFLNLVLTALYGMFVYASLGLFAGVPWKSDNIVIFNYILWIPLCISTVSVIVADFILKKRSKGKIILLCVNALYIPFEIIADFAQSTMSLTAIISFVTIALYLIIFIKEIKREYLPALRGK